MGSNFKKNGTERSVGSVPLSGSPGIWRQATDTGLSTISLWAILPSLDNRLLATEIAIALYVSILNALRSEVSLATNVFSLLWTRALNTVMRTTFLNTFSKIFFCFKL